MRIAVRGHLNLTDHRRGNRRSYSNAFKRRVVAEALDPGASVASVARHHGLNATMVFGWRRDPRFGPGGDGVFFLPVEVMSTAVTAAPEPISPVRDSRVEIALPSLRIPMKTATYSDGKRPVIPIQNGHFYRCSIWAV